MVPSRCVSVCSPRVVDVSLWDPLLLRCRFVSFPNTTDLYYFGDMHWATIGNPSWAMTDLVNLF